MSLCNRHSGSGTEFKDASQVSGMKGRQLDADSERDGPGGWRVVVAWVDTASPKPQVMSDSGDSGGL